MTSVADICNQALAEIGARATITSLDDPSKEAAACKIFYDSCRVQLLRAVHWGFARMTQPLTELGNLQAGTSVYPWAYKYAYPADCIRLRYVLCQPPTGYTPPVGESLFFNSFQMPSRDNRFLVSNDGTQRVILSNVQNAIAVYTFDNTDLDTWDSFFGNAMNSALAARLAIAISGNVGMKQQFEAEAAQSIIDARVADANETLSSTDHTPDWIRARGVPAYAGPIGVYGLGMWYQGYDTGAWGM